MISFQQFNSVYCKAAKQTGKKVLPGRIIRYMENKAAPLTTQMFFDNLKHSAQNRVLLSFFLFVKSSYCKILRNKV